MKNLKEIDSQIEALKLKYFREDAPEELTFLLKEAQVNMEVVASDKELNYIDHLIILNNIAIRLSKYLHLARSRNVFAECYRKLDYSDNFIKLVNMGLKQGESREKALLNIKEQKEIEIITDHIYRNIEAIHRGLERTITIVQSKLRSEQRDYNVQSKQ